MNKFYYAACFLLFPLVLFSQSDSGIVRYDDLSFNSDFEEKAFYEFHQGSKDILRLFVAIDHEVTEEIYNGFEQELQEELARLSTRKFKKASDEKKVRMLYDYVSVQFLTRYQEKVLFPYLFINGTFNCLTASALYGFLMDSLDIDYDFRETYNHVHPVAFPDNKKIKIETTNRLSGLQYYDDKLKNQFVDYLVNNNIIERDEYYAKSTEELFNEYFLPQSSIKLKELAGLHYMNDALYKFDSDNFSEAFEQIQKAYFIYPSGRMLTILQFILANTLAQADFNSIEDAKLFVFLSRLPAERLSPEEIGSGFAIITERILFNSSRTDYYDSFFEYLNENMEDGEVKNIISFEYYFLRGKSLIAHYMFRDGLELFVKAYQYNPFNLELQSLIISTLAITFENTPGNELVTRLESFAEEMPLLAENGMFASLQMMSYLVVVEQYFDFDDPGKALESLDKFEVLYSKNQAVEIDYELVGDAYSAAAVFYFKRYNKEKALDFLEKGLEIAPSNYELQYRLRSINE